MDSSPPLIPRGHGLMAGPPGLFACAVFLSISAALCVPQSLHAQASPGSQTLLDRVQAFYEAASGFHLVGDVERGDLAPLREMTFSAMLLEGSGYLVAGFCHQACRNLDLALLSPSGEEMVADDLPDAEPLLAFTAGESGFHTIRVAMRDCSIQNCPFAVGVFVGSRSGAAEPGGSLDPRLDLLRTELLKAGFREVDTGRSESLNQNGEAWIPISLQEGTEYRILGVCDDDCEDLDLSLLDPLGKEVDSDRDPDATPLLAYEPSLGGEYRVLATMVACWVEPCAYRIIPFGRGPPSSLGKVDPSASPVFQATHRGRLGPGDRETRDGRFSDEYRVEAKAGQGILVDLRSDEFDTLVILQSPGGTEERNDDFGADTGHSYLELLAPEDGTYTILVTSFSPEPGGAYILKITLVDG